MTAEGRFDNHCGSSIEWVHRDMGCSKNGTVFWLMFLHIFEGENENLWTLGVPPLSGKAISRIISNPVFFGQPLTDWDAKISKGRDGVGMVLMPSLRQWTIHFARKIFETCASDIPPQLMINVRLLFSKKNMKALIALACRIILYRFKIWGFFPNTDEFVFVYAKKGSAEGEMTLAYWGIR